GGGMYNSYSAPSVSYCTFSNNEARAVNSSGVSRGGGMFNEHATMVISNCTFSNNTTPNSDEDTYGGGMCNLNMTIEITDCEFSGNAACFGGGVYHEASAITVNNCTFSGNSLDTYPGGVNGSGMYVNGSSGSVSHCNFTGNLNHAALGIQYGTPIEVNHCTFLNNPVYGMTLQSAEPILTNCLFAGNAFGGLANWPGGNSSPTLTNCTFSENPVFANLSAITNYSTSTATLKNCILWGDGPSVYNPSGTVNISYSIVKQPAGVYSGTGNLNADPLFVGATDFHLQACSPAIDAGADAGAPADDLDGNTRVDAITGGNITDMGAYEYQTVLSDGTIWYVNAGAATSGNGTSWTCAFQDLQLALAAAGAGDQIWVAEGTYKPTTGTDRTISFAMKNGVEILGGFPNTGDPELDDRDWVANETILSGDIGTPNVKTDNTLNVVTSNDNDNTAVLDGFTVRDGYANLISNNRGGGFRIINSAAIIRNCVIRNNETRFASNTDHGAAMYLTNSSCQVESCVFTGNLNQTSSGCVYLLSGGNTVFTNCLFFGNSGGVSANSGAGAELTNCTVANNPPASITSFNATVVVKNSILRDNGIVLVQGTAPDVTYSITPGVYAGVGNLNVDPLFVDAANGDYHLQACSPAIDAGADAGVPATDLDGNARPFDAAPNVAADFDMGAYEYQELLPAPTAICQDITVQLDADGSFTVPAAEVNDGSTGCGTLAFLINDESSLTYTCDDLGNQTVTLTVTDAFDNTADCEATITVADDDNPCCAAPEALCTSYTAVLGLGGTATVAPADVDNGSTYECGLQSMTVSPDQFDCSDLGPQTVTLTVTDINGASGQCTATVTVVDNSLPGITCPGPVTVTCSSQVPAVNLAAVSASDNCGAPAKSHVGDATTNMTCANRKTVTRTYRATDGAGNSSTCSQVITVFDNVLPNFTFVPANVTVQCNSVPAVGSPTATDGCGGAVTITYNGQTRLDGTCTDRYTLTRQWTATDACGNTKTATQRINVIDSQQPNFTGTPANVTVQCDAIPAVASPTATDNCDASVAITYIGQTTTSGACPNAYTLTRRWTAADNCGNTRSVSQRITVVDNGKPVFTSFPANTAIACNDTPPPVGSPTASDACGSATVTYLGQTSVSGSCPGNYQLRRTWRATDACGNSTVSTQTIQVSDTGAPVFTSTPGPITIECGDPLPPLVNPTASDACGGYAAITFLGNVPSGSGCAADYTVTRTWRAEDLCGNSATTSQVITVLGNSYGEEGAENRKEDVTGLITHRSSLIVTPNPTTDRIQLDLTDFAGESVTVSIHSDLGQLIWERRIPAVEDLKLPISLREAGAAAGMYTVSVRSASGVTAKRVVLVE
ncbi:MAG: right-handed parallel beta-helix repeat-containing protein, partial [Saprospiraceae bacterium]|nr:right-handed parallel beta-helix repeat-containing protein [Saprospiraceae bacterium]